MKTFSLLLAVFGLALAGCESISDATGGIREKLAARNQPHTRTFAAEPRATYEAARGALDQMDFRFLRGGPAQGELEGMGGVSPGDTPGSARQIAITVRLSPAATGGTEVRVWLREIIEEDPSHNTGRATESPLRDTGLYEAFFRNLQQGLGPSKQG